MTILREHLNPYVLTARPDQTLEQAAQEMVERKVGAAVVLVQGTVVGIVTERDVMRAVARGLVPWNTSIEEIMTKDPLFATPETDVHDAITVMLDHGFRHLPVVDEGKLVGIVSARHLLRITESSS
ncbi:MAG TPA: CBS domain-containing protein [Actinomycetota bacterium]|nr:CBS domain-containing protein [Actinomycetota bacterium]